MPGETWHIDDILEKIEAYLHGHGEISSEDIKNRTKNQLKEAFKEEIDLLIESLTQSEREYLLKQVDRIIAREWSNEKLEILREMVDGQIKKKADVNDKKEELYWNKDAILKDLKENHVTVYENQEMMWYKWKIVEINLPWAWEDYNPFKYFVSYKLVRKDTFESNPELEKNSYSMEEVWNLLKAINNYMKAMGVEIDTDVDYENDLKTWEHYTKKGKLNNHKSVAWDCFNDIAWLNDWYWLKDKDVAWSVGSRAHWHNNFDYSEIVPTFYNDLYSAHLFLKLS